MSDIQTDYDAVLPRLMAARAAVVVFVARGEKPYPRSKVVPVGVVVDVELRASLCFSHETAFNGMRMIPQRM